ncbi:hypothetical protein K443DRAFT_131477 [Laccaria amethystina LaAM-08-1]|uniref:Unplaced genomic scaffold K443scaffold_47, whole genome shotgun sequence n=1 Tax=Laccaria amethystina LaAM-08-1 TaxID=1095629 RepID=A0A0C9XZS5_9AGAR|nr:hypothetical protein K443DRAFT_131477 [Laccaria amethystina LaAM-08-1]
MTSFEIVWGIISSSATPVPRNAAAPPSQLFPFGEGGVHGFFPTTLGPYIAAVLFETFLYGIYFILFFIGVYLLLRKKRPLRWVLLASAVIMFSLATADIIYTYHLVFNRLLARRLTFTELFPKYMLFVTNNVLADSLLLYRCYVVWGFKKYIIIAPAILLIAGTVCGYTFEGASSILFNHAWIYLSMTFALNVIATGLTAGKIWYLAHKAELILGEGLLRRYNTSIAILIESGIMYSVYIALDLAFQKNATAHAILDCGFIQIVGIMPTLIIVQVGLGGAVNDFEANEALSRVEANKIAHRSYIEGVQSVRGSNRSFPEDIPCAPMRSPHCFYGSNDTFSGPG